MLLTEGFERGIIPQRPRVEFATWVSRFGFFIAGVCAVDWICSAQKEQLPPRTSSVTSFI